MRELTFMRGILGRLRKWIRATREEGLGPMGTDLETLRDIADVLEAGISELEDDLNTAELDNEYLREQLRHIEQLERDSAYMRLPVDADGVPTKPGDRVYGYGRKEDGMTVRFIDQHGNLMVGDTGTTSMYECLYWTAENVTHHKPDTVESLLDEMLEEAKCVFHEDGSCEMGVTYERRAEYAERIRKAVEHE